VVFDAVPSLAVNVSPAVPLGGEIDGCTVNTGAGMGAASTGPTAALNASALAPTTLVATTPTVISAPCSASVNS
jgi:hypothetical protein